MLDLSTINISIMKPCTFICLIALVFTPISNAIAQPSSLPTAASSTVTGFAGEHYNLVNSSGEKNGLWIRVWDNGSLYYKGSFSNGKPSGPFLYFYETGELMSSLDHTENQTAAIHYRRNGSVQASGYYLPAEGDKAPLKIGSWGFYNTGSVQIRSESYLNGELSGAYWVKDEKGQLIEEGAYKLGERNGAWTTYYDNRSIRQHINYLAGELEGEFVAYFSNGMPKIEGKYFEGKEDGTWKTYSEKGELEMVIRYQFGKKAEETRVNGAFEDTFLDGRSKSEYTFRDRELDGPYRIWYDQGGYSIEPFTDPQTGEQLQQRILVGVQVKEEGAYKNGLLDGPVYYYDTDGKLARTDHYKDGVVQ